MKKIIITMILVITAITAWAQNNLFAYDKDNQQVIMCQVSPTYYLTSLAIMNEKDFNTVQYDENGRVTELTNSLGTLVFEYEDDCINVKYNIDGHLLSRHVYHYQDGDIYKKLESQMKEWADQGLYPMENGQWKMDNYPSSIINYPFLYGGELHEQRSL